MRARKTSEDRDALTRPAWTLYEQDVGATAAFGETKSRP
jgi:hypothetical protein